MSRYAAESVEMFEQPKIISARFMASPIFGWDDGNRYTNDACYIFPGNFYILALLNSPVCWFLITHIATLMQSGYYQIHVQYLEQIPVPNASPAQRTTIEGLVQKLIDVQGRGLQVAEWEAELNRLVYEVYGLNEVEIRLIEASVK
jgi:hypothetical protein